MFKHFFRPLSDLYYNNAASCFPYEMDGNKKTRLVSVC